MPRTEHATDSFDPFSQWQTMRDRTMDTWSKMMLDFVHSDAYASASAQWLDSYLNVSKSFQDTVDQVMTQTLNQYKVPSTEDITRLAERIWSVELKLDDLDARLAEMMKLLKEVAARPAAPAPAAAAAARPAARTAARRPAKSAAKPAKSPAAAAPKLAKTTTPVLKSTGPLPAAKPVEPSATVAKAAEPASPVAKPAEAVKAAEAAKAPDTVKAGNGAVAPTPKPSPVAVAAHAETAGEKKSKENAGAPAATGGPADAVSQEKK